VQVAPDISIKIHENEKIDIAVAISHFDKVFMWFFLIQFSLVFARWNRRLEYESIPSELVKKMPTASERYRHLLALTLASLAWLRRRD